MDETKAMAVADALDGQAWNSRESGLSGWRGPAAAEVAAGGDP